MSGVGGGVLLLWPKFSLLVDVALILSTDNTRKDVRASRCGYTWTFEMYSDILALPILALELATGGKLLFAVILYGGPGVAGRKQVSSKLLVMGYRKNRRNSPRDRPFVCLQTSPQG